MNISDEEYNIITLIYRRLARCLGKNRIKLALCFFLAACFAVLFCTGILSFGYDAYIDKQYIGTVRNRTEIENRIEAINDCPLPPVDKPLNLYPRIVIYNSFTPENQITDNLKLSCGNMRRGTAFYLNSEPLFALDSSAEMQSLIDPYISVFQTGENTPVTKEGIYHNSLFLSCGDALRVLESQLAEIPGQKEEAVETAGVASGIFARPIPGAVTSDFGQRWGRMHKGTDFAGNTGDDVKASDSGVVAFAGYESSFGNFIILNHNNGYETYYAHLSKIYVTTGDKVKKGDVIGAVGDTGNSLGPHLHFEIRENGDAKNPLDFLP